MRSDRRARSRPRRYGSGLTLVELLVAISVLAFVAVIGWRGLDTIVRARTMLSEQLEQTRRLQLSFAQLQSDCSQLAPPALLVNRPPLRVDSGRLSLIRTVRTEGQPTRVQVVSYVVRDGVLTRIEMPATRVLTDIDVQMQSAAAGTATGYAVAMQPGVQSIAMRLWANDDRGWRTSEDSASMNQNVQAASEKAKMIAQATGTPVDLTMWTGLEMTLVLQGQAQPMLKVFLLGAA